VYLYFSIITKKFNVDGKQMTHKYDLIVVGAGHAGIEAALASAKMGLNTLMLTILV